MLKYQNSTIDDQSLDFYWNIQMVGSEIGIKNTKAWIDPYVNSLGCCCLWCNAVGNILLAHFGCFFSYRSFISISTGLVPNTLPTIIHFTLYKYINKTLLLC